MTRSYLTRGASMVRRTVGAWLALGLVVGVIGCGGTGADPFVGTWRNTDPQTKPDTRVVIAEADGTYHLAAYDESGPLPFEWSLTRQGDELSGTFVPEEPNPPMRLTVTYQPDTGHLLMRESVGPASELERVSAATGLPAPSVGP